MRIGVNYHGTWSSYTDAQRNMVLAAFASKGVDSVRLDLSWEMFQTRRTYVDRIIGMCSDYAIKPLVMFWLTPAWARPVGTSERSLPTKLTDYADAIGQAAAAYAGRVVGWEVWNEPNSADFMTGASPVAYAHLLHVAYDAVKQNDPNALVVSGGVQYNDTAWLTTMLKNSRAFDVLGVHPYMGPSDFPPESPDDGNMWNMRGLTRTRSLLQAAKIGQRPIWLTEAGWSSHTNEVSTASWNRGVSESLQAEYMARTGLMSLESLGVDRVYWYTDRDESTGNPQYDNYGVFRTDFTAKPALEALATGYHP